MLSDHPSTRIPSPEERTQLTDDLTNLNVSLDALSTSWAEIRRDALVLLSPLLGEAIPFRQRSTKQIHLAQVIALLDDLADVPVCDQAGCLEQIEDGASDFCPKHSRRNP